ncbi:class I SAM-dependent methyltransferase [Pontibacter sp. MBLB2868]|uniref:class I SAM-dependent methyltransferase n=1 Tax=Pontibacter sp. MBLB2868 TaxID=3451555 RepID=UPI003F74BA29
MEVKATNKAKELATAILKTNKIHDELGKEHILDSNIDFAEGIFIEKLVRENGFVRTIEVGCANGISSLFICSALPSENGHHTIIDPFQSTDWKSIGITQLRNAGVGNFSLIEEVSEIALPKLLIQGAKFDFAFIDGWHTFDHTLLDIFYMNKLLKVGGIMVIDDVSMPGVEKAVNYFLRYPCFDFVEGVKLSNTARRDSFNKYVINSLNKVAKILPSKIREEIFSGKVAGNYITGYSMVAMRKTEEDKRPWNWYVKF